MLNKPINPEPYNTYITKDENEIIGCDIPSNKKIIGDYTKVIDIETSEIVYEAHSHYEDNPKSRIEYKNVLTNAESGKEYAWNTLYWEKADEGGAETTLVENVEINDEQQEVDTITVGQLLDAKPYYTIYAARYRYGEETWSGADTIGSSVSPFISISGDIVTIEYWKYRSRDVSINQTAYYTKSMNLLNKKGYAKIFMKHRDGSGNWDFNEYWKRLISFEINSSWSSRDDRYIDEITFQIFDDNGKISDNTRMLNDIQTDFGNCMVQIFPVDEIGYGIGQMMSLTYNSNSDTEGQSNKKECYLIKDVNFDDTYPKLQIYPSIKHNINKGATITFLPGNIWNVSPDYYFRCKSNPIITIDSSPSKITRDNLLHDIQSEFSVNFIPGENCVDMNYYQLYLYALSPNGKYNIVEKSNKLFSPEDSHLFSGFVNNTTYKVVAICIDNEGDEWTDEVTFTAQYNILNATSNVKFDNECYATKIIINQEDFITSVDDNEANTNYKIYKHRKGYLCADYVGEFLETDSFLTDYNIQNDMDYTYYMRINYMNAEGTNVVMIRKIGDITPDFLGSCVMGIENSGNRDYRITKVFYLNYHFNDLMHESTQHLSRDYIGNFGKYEQELKGTSNYITSVAEGLLGYEAGGGYAEANSIKNDWLNFINDDSVKLYKGFDGNTMIISITESRVKPRYYEEYGIVNEVNISFQQIGDTENSTIYETEV